MIFVIEDVVGKSLLGFAADIESKLASGFAGEYNINGIAELFAKRISQGFNDYVIVSVETIELPEEDTPATREFLKESILGILNSMSAYEVRDIFEACWNGPKVHSRRPRARRPRS